MQTKFNHLLNQSVLLLKTDGSDVLLKVDEVGMNYVAGKDDEGANTTVLDAEISDYLEMQ